MIVEVETVVIVIVLLLVVVMFSTKLMLESDAIVGPKHNTTANNNIDVVVHIVMLW